MKNKAATIKLQLRLLVAMRFLIGCHLFVKGISQVIHPEWPSLAFLLESNGNMPGLSHLITANLNVLCAADFLNTWLLIALGLGLILGHYSRRAVLAGAVLLALYYLVLPNYIGSAINVLQESNYLFVNQNLFEALALILISISSVARKFGLDALFDCRKKLLILSSHYKLNRSKRPEIRKAHREALTIALSDAS